jgi:hypothetical protein
MTGGSDSEHDSGVTSHESTYRLCYIVGYNQPSITVYRNLRVVSPKRNSLLLRTMRWAPAARGVGWAAVKPNAIGPSQDWYHNVRGKRAKWTAVLQNVAWIGSRVDREELARRMPPLTYARAGLPPIMTVQGDRDPIVPRSNGALEKAGVPHQLITLPGGKRGNFTGDEYVTVYGGVRQFLAKYDLLPK